MKSLGIDGCKKGWFTVELTDVDWTTMVYKNINEIWDYYKNTNYITIDIPIGMRKNENMERKCDLEARRILGPGRESSVFPVPCREATYASSYEEAHKINKQKVNRGLSKQTWGIIPKIREVDILLMREKDSRNQIQESHPEIAFWALNGRKALKYNKKSENGIEERIEILSKYDGRILDIYEKSLAQYLRKEVAKDDILDAICMAITGALAQSKNYKTIPSIIEKDEEGIEMKIVYYGGII